MNIGTCFTIVDAVFAKVLFQAFSKTGGFDVDLHEPLETGKTSFKDLKVKDVM